MKKNTRSAFLLRLACDKQQQDISDQTSVQTTPIENDDLMQDQRNPLSLQQQNITPCKQRTTVNVNKNSCEDDDQASDKENDYIEDSDDSVKDPNFEIMTCANKDTSSDDSSGRPAKKRVRRVSNLSSTAQSLANTEMPGPSGCITENYDPTPSTSKCIPTDIPGLSGCITENYDPTPSTSNCIPTDIPGLSGCITENNDPTPSTSKCIPTDIPGLSGCITENYDPTPSTSKCIPTEIPALSGCITENYDPTPSTSKCIPQHRMSTSSGSSSSTSGSSTSSSSSSSSSSASSSRAGSRSNSSNNYRSTTEAAALAPGQESTFSPGGPDNNIIENDVPQLDASPVRKSCKKRKSCVEKWLSNEAKTLRNAGKAYISRSKSKKSISARCLQPPCGEKCKLQCTTKIDEASRSTIFENYWKLGDLALQRNFIHKHMKPIIPAFRFSGKAQPRKVNHSFYFEVEGQTIRVCKTFFRATLAINDRVIRTVIDKSEDGFLQQDMRGKHNNHKKVAESIRQGIRDHINSIPRIESHYIRKNSSREYIDGGKSLSDLYRDYKALCESKNAPYANETLYSRIFNGEYNISFFKPKKDRCELCVRYENSEGNEKKNLEIEYLKHIEEKELSRKEKDADKANSNPDKIVAVYDLQAILQVPRGNTSVFYYKSKLNTLNFTVSHIGNNDGKTECFFWHEGEANRGADEIASCVFKFIENTQLGYDGPGLDLIFYSDNCCGQNKNRFIIAIYLFALVKFSKIKSITHKYLITGHTQNEADSVHSTIEKQIQKRLKSGPIYVPSQYVEAIKCAKKKGKPYAVTEMSSSEFYSVKRLSEDIGFTPAKSFKITEMRVIKLMQDDPTKLLYKTSLKDDQFSETIITRKKNLNQITLKPAYRSKPKLKDNKIKDLQSLLQNNHIPHFYEPFYNSLK